MKGIFYNIMENKMQVVENLSDKSLSEYLDVMGLAPKLNEKEKLQFLTIAKTFGLNPFKREIYCTVYGEGQYKQFSIITGYEVYIKRAERSGLLDGWNATTTGSVATNDLKAIVTIHRKDRTQPFVWETYYDECVQTKKDGTVTKFWEKANFMTKKVAISQAFRLCFSDEIGGMPYTSDEVAEQIIDVSHTIVSEGTKTDSLKPKIFNLNQKQFDKLIAFEIADINALRNNLLAIDEGNLTATPEQIKLLTARYDELELQQNGN